jgi:hypothetical protein
MVEVSTTNNKRRKLDQAFEGLTNLNYTAEVLNQEDEPKVGGT